MESIVRTLLTPLRPLHSPGAQRAYITTFLFSLSASFLLFLATISYVLFYINYIPNITISKDIYLTYPPPPLALSNIPYSHGGGVVLSLSPSPNDRPDAVEFPTGTAELGSHDLIPNQKYDVEVEMRLPTSPLNRDLGNFMVDLELWSPPVPVPAPPPPPPGTPPAQQQAPVPHLLHKSLRPAILTFHSPLPSLLSTILRTPLLLTHLAQESESITVPLLHKVSFPTRAQTPQSVKVTLRAQRVQTYAIRIRFKARLGGLRNVMYTYRLAAASMFISAFWVIEVVCAMGVWYLLAFNRGAGTVHIPDKIREVRVKLEAAEEEDILPTVPVPMPMPESLRARPSTPGARSRTPGRTYLPSPSPTPQPQPPPQQDILPEAVREGYAADEETETEASTIDGDGAEEADGADSERAGRRRRRRRGGVMVEEETETEESEEDEEEEMEGEEEEAVLVSGGAGRAGDSGVGTSVYESSATGREQRRGSSGSAGAGAVRRR